MSDTERALYSTEEEIIRGLIERVGVIGILSAVAQLCHENSCEMFSIGDIRDARRLSSVAKRIDNLVTHIEGVLSW